LAVHLRNSVNSGTAPEHLPISEPIAEVKKKLKSTSREFKQLDQRPKTDGESRPPPRDPIPFNQPAFISARRVPFKESISLQGRVCQTDLRLN
jgi:hypothetical protein